jgi:hypothetical protein
MKLKLKHLRAFLSCADVSTNTCKDKQDLAELVMKTRSKYNLKTNNNNNNRSQSNNNTNSNNNNNNNNNSFNDRFSGFMNNVQDFVNFNLNSVINPNNPVPAPPPPRSSSTTGIPRSNTNYGSSGHHSSSSSSFIPTNVFNFIGEQIPNVLQQTFNSFSSSNNDNNHNHQSRRQSNSSNNSNTNTSNQYERHTPTPPVPTPPPPQQQPAPTPTPTPAPVPPQPPIKRRASVSDLNSENDIENLSVKQIKEILANNFVEYKGCCEKKELVEKLKRLYNSHLENKRIEQELNNIGASNVEAGGCASGGASSSKRPDESDICKICMESIIDCVLLDCGHMCSCIKCGKQLGGYICYRPNDSKREFKFQVYNILIFNS